MMVLRITNSINELNFFYEIAIVVMTPSLFLEGE
jgi:hypothetical protein